jgi:hypothetical protein
MYLIAPTKILTINVLLTILHPILAIVFVIRYFVLAMIRIIGPDWHLLGNDTKCNAHGRDPNVAFNFVDRHDDVAKWDIEYYSQRPPLNVCRVCSS